MKVQIYTFGCTVNQSETQEIRAQLLLRGDELVEHGAVDAVIINSCAVTSSAENSTVELIHRIRKKYPQVVIAVIGCYGESLMRKNRAENSGADIVLGNTKAEVVELLHRKCNSRLGATHASPVSPRAYLKVQNGCDNCCSYCIVPILRGKSTSKPMAEIERELASLVRQGSKEIVIAGINLALYRDGMSTLVDVLKKVDSIDGLEQFRLSSLEPAAFTDELIEELPKFKKLCPHFHISLQSGNDRTLKAMRRQYTFDAYLSILTRIRERIPGVAITTDIIVGFPGESDDDFTDGCKNIVRCMFSDIHIFKYSMRPGTEAASMPAQIAQHKKVMRAHYLEGVKEQTRYQYRQTLVGGIERVLVTRFKDGQLWEGISAHNVNVLFSSDAPPGDMCQVKIESISPDGDSMLGNSI